MLFGSVSQYIVDDARAHGGRAGAVSGADRARSSWRGSAASAESPRFSSASRPPWPRATRARRWPWCRCGRTCPGREAPRGRLAAASLAHAPAPARGRTLNRRGRFRAWVACAGFAGLVAYDVPRRAGADARRNWRSARPCWPTARRRALPSSSICRSTSRTAAAHARGDRHRAARHLGDRPAAAAGARRRAAGGSWPERRRAQRRRLQPSWVAMLDFVGLGDGTDRAGDAVDRDEHRRDLQPALAGAARAR